MRENMLAPLMDFVILPEVKDPRQWWGGHMWEDNIKTNRYIYSFSADFSAPPFFNADLVKPGEITSYEVRSLSGSISARMPSRARRCPACFRLAT